MPAHRRPARAKRVPGRVKDEHVWAIEVAASEVASRYRRVWISYGYEVSQIREILIGTATDMLAIERPQEFSPQQSLAYLRKYLYRRAFEEVLGKEEGMALSRGRSDTGERLPAKFVRMEKDFSTVSGGNEASCPLADKSSLAGSPSDEAAFREYLEKVPEIRDRAIAEIPRKGVGEVFDLIVAGLPRKEISDRTGINLAAVRVMYREIERSVRDYLVEQSVG